VENGGQEEITIARNVARFGTTVIAVPDEVARKLGHAP
jgi:hypothetical protein